MKKFLLIITVSLLIYSCNKNKSQSETSKTTTKTVFNSELAKKYGADDYGMKKYVIAFLKRGPNQSLDSLVKIELQKAHMANITKLAESGKLVLAGPFLGNEDLRGIYIFDVTSIDEAKALTETDPAIQQGTLEMELKEWYGSAAILAINDIHKTIAKIEI